MAAAAEKFKLHDLCQNGTLEDVQEYLANERNTSLNEQAGIFGYTPLHEAASSSKNQILRLLLSLGSEVNSLSNGRHTALHIAASKGDIECIKVLLEFQADVSIVDEFGQTALSICQLNKSNKSKTILNTVEILLMAATIDSEEDFQKRMGIEDLRSGRIFQDNCFEEALTIAVARNNHKMVGVLVANGARNVNESLDFALLQPSLAEVAVLLFLCRAAKTGDIEIVQLICDNLNSRDFPGLLDLEEMDDTYSILSRMYLPEEWNKKLTKVNLWTMRQAAKCIDMAVPICIALREGHTEAAKIMIFGSYCYHGSGEADWRALKLQNIPVSWLDQIIDFKKLLLAQNDLTEVPSNVIYMNNLHWLDLSKNSISEIPKKIFQLPQLKVLNFSHNKIKKLPEVEKWSSSIHFLYLNANQLKDVPESICQSELKDLNLSDNKLTCIQDCICCIKTLKSLDISSNRAITFFPPKLAMLKHLYFLGISNMDQVVSPRPEFRRSTVGVMRYLRAKLRNSVAYYTMKLMILGSTSQGKTTLLHCLDRAYSCDISQPTNSVDVREIFIKRARAPSFTFRCWDFAGKEDYYATHQCFLSPRSLYLLVWKVSDGAEAIAGLKPWLDSLETRVPYATVIIVGTHLDEISVEERAQGFELKMKSNVRELLNNYRKITVAEITYVAGPTATYVEIANLQDLIYSVAENMTDNGPKIMGDRPKIMGDKVPSSFLSLAEMIEDRQRDMQENNKIPILRKHEFEALVIKNAEESTSDIFDPDDVDNAARFLHNIGTILHYDDPNQHLSDLYFVDPKWLCDCLATSIANQTENSLLRSESPYLTDLHSLCGINQKFPEEFLPQYLRLLYRFQIAFQLDENMLLIPAKFPNNLPAACLEPSGLKRQHLFNRIPGDFWDRLISRVLMYLPNMLTDGTGSNILSNDNHPIDLSYLFGNKYLRCWKKGILFSHPKLFLSVNVVPFNSNRQIIETKVSRNLLGYRAMGYIVDHIRTLVKEWYPGLSGHDEYEPYLPERVTCPICEEFGQNPPFKFDVSDCLQTSRVQEYIVCPKSHDPQNVSLSRICPDIMFMDLPRNMQLNSQQLNYEESDDSLLGFGSFGKVYKGEYDGRAVAVKIHQSFNYGVESQRSSLTESVDAFFNMRQEVVILSKVNHPNIIDFVGVSVHSSLCSVTELAPHGNLRSAIEGNLMSLSGKRIVVYRIAQQIASALNYMHKLGIVHRDLKPDNVLMFSTESESEVNIKLTGFHGADCFSRNGVKQRTGTFGFLAPEILDPLAEYTARGDVYSFSMILYELITKRSAHKSSAMDIDNLNNKKRPCFGDIDSAGFGFLTLTELMLKAWGQEAVKRPSSYDVFQQLSSPCFSLLFGKRPLGKIQDPRHCCFLPEQNELWICFADPLAGASVAIMDMTNGKIKATFILQVDGATGNGYFYIPAIYVIDKNHVAIILKSTSEHVILYSSNDKTFLKSYLVNDNCLRALAVSEHFVFVGCENGGFARIAKNDFIDGKFGEANTLVNFQRAIPVLVTNEFHLFVGYDKNVYKHPLGRDVDGMMGVKSVTENRQVASITLSPDGLMVFISFKDSPIVACRLSETMNCIGDIDCSSMIKMIFPQSQACDQHVACLCVHCDTLWVATGSGHILIYEIKSDSAPSFITWLQPHKLGVRCMISCKSAGSAAGLNFVATVGKELNSKCLSHNLDGVCELTASFPIDDSLQLKEQPEDPIIESKYFVLIWDAVGAAALRKVCSMN